MDALHGGGGQHGEHQQALALLRFFQVGIAGGKTRRLHNLIVRGAQGKRNGYVSRPAALTVKETGMTHLAPGQETA
jgi:hypothetical protein